MMILKFFLGSRKYNDTMTEITIDETTDEMLLRGDSVFNLILMQI